MIIETITLQRPIQAAPAVEPRRRARRRLLATACWAYLLVIMAIWLIMRQTGDRWWFGTLLLIVPRWPYSIPLAALWPWAIRARRWGLCATLVAATAVMLIPILGFRLSLPNTNSERGDVRVLTCNVHREHLDADGLADYVAAVQPDIVAIQGWSATNHEALFAEDGWNVHREGELLLASRFPIGEVTPIDLDDHTGVPPGQRGAAAIFELQTPQGPIHLINLHLASPHASLLTVSSDAGGKLADNVERRWRESDLVRAAADRVQGPLLLTGDFNTTDDSPIFREHWDDFADAFSKRGTGFGYTYLVGHTQIRIDHLLAGPSWQVLRCWVGPHVGSPHRPLMADLVFQY